LSLEEIEKLFRREGDVIHNPFDNLTDEQKQAILKNQSSSGGGH